MEKTGLVTGEDGLERCSWHGNLEDYRRYHDEEWGRPVIDDNRLFEKSASKASSPASLG